jgi:hypothetical protein
MAAMTPTARLVLTLGLALAAAGCASGGPPAGRSESPPRVRCLANPGETQMRPLIFFFCAESP